MALNFRNDDRAGDNQSCANPVSPGQVLPQEEHGQNHGDHDTELVNRCHFGCFAKLQGAEIAQPRWPVARPDNIRNNHVRVVALLDVSKPRYSAMLHAKTRITTARMAVARLESMPLTPALASTAVRPANRAESNAQWSQFMRDVLKE